MILAIESVTCITWYCLCSCRIKVLCTKFYPIVYLISTTLPSPVEGYWFRFVIFDFFPFSYVYRFYTRGMEEIIYKRSIVKEETLKAVVEQKDVSNVYYSNSVLQYIFGQCLYSLARNLANVSDWLDRFYILCLQVVLDLCMRIRLILKGQRVMIFDCSFSFSYSILYYTDETSVWWFRSDVAV